MTMAYATVTGRIVIPGTATGVPGELRATPLTEGGVLAFPLEDTVTLGPAVADVAADGTLSQDGTPGIKIPTAVPAGTLWRLVFHPKGKGNLPTRLGDFEITADTTTGDLVPVQVMAITPTVADNIAAAAALGATNDTATASFINTPGSATEVALKATIAAGTPVPVTHPAGLARWRAALGRAMFTRARLVVHGDSISVGAYANDTAGATNADKLLWAQRGWVGQLRRLLAATYGDAGEGWIGFNTDEGRWTYTGTTSTSAAGPVVSGRQINAGGQAAATALGPFTEVEVLGYHGTSTPPVNLFVDAVDKTPALLTDAQHTLTVSASAWANRANTALAAGTESSENILTATSAAGGNMSFQTPITVGNGLPCVAGDKFIVAADLKSTASSRAWRAGLIFFDAAGVSLTEATTVDVTASTVGSWQTKSNLVTAPANTAYAAMIVRIDAAGAASEEHKVRRVRAIPVATVTGSSGATLWRATRSGLSDATHDVTLKGAATGNVLTGGIIIKRGSVGVLVSRVAKSGTTTANHAGTDQSAGTQTNMLAVGFDLMRADLAVIALGANDIPNQLANGITPAVFKANLLTLANKAVTNGGCVLLVAGPRYASEVAGGDTQATYYQQMSDLAAEQPHIAFVDVGKTQWKDNATANTLGFMNNALVGIHPLMAGHGDYARTVFEAVTSRALGTVD